MLRFFIYSRSYACKSILSTSFRKNSQTNLVVWFWKLDESLPLMEFYRLKKKSGRERELLGEEEKWWLVQFVKVSPETSNVHGRKLK
jgi:hypothetical protein